MHLVKKEDIVLINLVANSGSETEKIALYIGRCGANKYAETKSDETRASERKPISLVAKATSWMRKPRGRRVSYSRITFATLESHREVPLSPPVRSFSLMRFADDAPVFFLRAHIFSGRSDTACSILLFIALRNDTGAFDQASHSSIALHSVP